jgi:hypothetical protein
MHEASLSDIVAQVASHMNLNRYEAADVCLDVLARYPSSARRRINRLRVRRARRRERLRMAAIRKSGPA